jgi:hypothetical protein
MAKETWFACENGHPVTPGSTICTQCGGQVTDRRVPAPDIYQKAADEIEGMPAPTGTPVPTTKTDIQKRTTLIVALAAGMSTLIAGIVLFFVASQTQDTVEPAPTPTTPAMSCAGIAPELELGLEYGNAPAVWCFEVDEETIVNLTAHSDGGEALGFEVERADGVFWAATPGVEGADPVLSSYFLEGAYVVTVTGESGAEPGAFMLVTSVGDPDSPWDTSDPDLPGIDDCGGAETPLLEFATRVAWLSSDGDVVNACLTLDEAAFVKFRADARTGGADLNLVVYEFGDDGRPVYVRSVNDTFGTDPEMSLDLEAGTYLVGIEEWQGEAVGGFALYASTDPEYHREGEVSEARAYLTPDDCASGDIPTVEVGDSLMYTANDPVACLEVDNTQRLVLKAVSFSGQDLILEVIGFMADGTPYRFSWVDDDLWATDFDDLDPVLDTYVPAGTYVLSVTEYSGQTPEYLMIAVDPASE